MFDNHKILLFWLKNKRLFRMFSLRDLRSLLCSRRTICAKDYGLFNLITHKSTRSVCDQMEVISQKDIQA